MTGVLIKIGNWETDTPTWKMPHEDKGRVQGDISINYKIPKIINKPPQKRRERCGIYSTSQYSEGTNILILDF